MRKLGIGIGILILVVMVAIGIFAATFDVNRYHALVQSELERRLGRQVTLGEMHLGIVPPRFRVQDIAIADDSSFNSQIPFVQAKELDVAVKLMPLLQKDIEIDSLNLQRPSVELIKNQQGKWNFSSVGASSQPAKTSGNQQFSLAALTIEDGQVAITDQQSASNLRSVYDHIDVTLRDFAPNQPFSIDAAAHLPGAGKQEVRLKGTGGPIMQAEPATTPFQGTVNLQSVAIAGLQHFLNSPALVNTDGIVSGNSDISNQAGKLAVKGQLSVQQGKIRGTELGFPVTADYDITDDLKADAISIRNTNLKLGATPLNISGTVNAKPTPPELNLDLKASNVSIAEAAKLASAAGMGASAAVNVTGNVNADIKATGAATKPALNGTINGRDIQASGKDIAQPVQIKSINLRLTPNEIVSDNFNVTSGGTTLSSQFSVRDYTAKSPAINATAHAANAALPQILAMAKAYGVTSLDKLTGAGTLNLDLKAAGTLQAMGSNEIMRALNGAIVVAFNNVRYAGTDINHEVASIGGFLKGNEADKGYTNISKVTGNIAIKSGIAQTSNLQALLDLGSVGVTGTANLVDQTLNLHVVTVMSKDSSQKAGGTGVGGYMQSALANNQGELVVPAVVTGTFQKPKFTPDLQQVARMKLNGLVPNFSNPSAAVSGVLGNLLGQKPANQQTPQSQDQQQSADPVQQIMGLFGKKKPATPPAQPPK
ncbi:MAG: AsmA family protein [Acidobacteriaceae bacterium]